MATEPLVLWQSAIGFAKQMARRRARLVRRFMGNCVEDFEQAALLALWKAALMYRDDCHASFCNYAWHHIRGELNCENWRQNFFGFKAGKAQAYKHIDDLPARVFDEDVPEDKIPQTSGLEQLLEDKDLVQWLIKQLRPQKAQIVARRFWLEGLPTLTIAHQLALSVTRIEQIRAQAKKDLIQLANSLQRMWNR